MQLPEQLLRFFGKRKNYLRKDWRRKKDTLPSSSSITGD
jgi:hypothetical protein